MSIHKALGSVSSTVLNWVHACCPRIQEVEAGGSDVQGYSLLHREFKATLVYMRPYLKGKKKLLISSISSSIGDPGGRNNKLKCGTSTELSEILSHHGKWKQRTPLTIDLTAHSGACLLGNVLSGSHLIKGKQPFMMLMIFWEDCTSHFPGALWKQLEVSFLFTILFSTLAYEESSDKCCVESIIYESYYTP